AYTSNSWLNYSVQARLRFQTNGFGGGLGGRLNAANGAHYAAWIYPENSPGCSSVLKLIKFQDWRNFTPMQQTNLATVGTNYHTVKLTFLTNLITVLFDSNQVMSVPDTEAQPYTSGTLSVDMWTDTLVYSMFVDDV